MNIFKSKYSIGWWLMTIMKMFYVLIEIFKNIFVKKVKVSV